MNLIFTFSELHIQESFKASSFHEHALSRVTHVLLTSGLDKVGIMAPPSVSGESIQIWSKSRSPSVASKSRVFYPMQYSQRISRKYTNSLVSSTSNCFSIISIARIRCPHSRVFCSPPPCTRIPRGPRHLARSALGYFHLSQYKLLLRIAHWIAHSRRSWGVHEILP